MMKIAIVEDERSCRKQLETNLKSWSEKHDIMVNISDYESGEELLLDGFSDHKLIFLDIDLPNMSGMEIAQKLRQSGYRDHIIFVTAHNEYVYEGYHVRALDYILKPITLETLERCLNPVLHELESSTYILRTATSIEKISYASIIAFATQGHYVEIITDQCTYRQKISLKVLKQLLPEDFVQCHRTLIVNINHVVKLDGKNLHLSNRTVYPISRQYMQSVQNAFINCTI